MIPRFVMYLACLFFVPVCDVCDGRAECEKVVALTCVKTRTLGCLAELCNGSHPQGGRLFRIQTIVVGRSPSAYLTAAVDVTSRRVVSCRVVRVNDLMTPRDKTQNRTERDETKRNEMRRNETK